MGPQSTDYTINIPSTDGDAFSSFLLYVTTTDVAVTLSNVVVNTSDYSGTIDIEGCMDSNATNYNEDATVQGYDQYGNIQCAYASCNDIPEFGCIYDDGFGPFNEFFDAIDCSSYGGIPCEEDSENVSGCTDQNASNYNSAATIDDGSCQYPTDCNAPNDWNVIVTSSNHTIVIPSDAIVTLADGNVLDHANVGVFYTNSDGNLACAGSAEITPGETVQIAAMGDDTTTDEVDGLVSGSDLVWMIADCYGNVFAANATYAAGPEIFTINGITNVSAITEAPAGPSEQELSFPTGWSMFSTYMVPSDLNLANLLSPIVDQVIIAKDYLGAAYLPEWNFNGIGDLTLGQGYQIKTTESTGVTVTGDYAMPQDNPINLTVGWNMVAYLGLEPACRCCICRH